MTGTDDARQRCPWTVAITPQIASQCDRQPHADPIHEGGGITPGQRIRWAAGDRREYTGAYPGRCPFPGCILPNGHPGDCSL